MRASPLAYLAMAVSASSSMASGGAPRPALRIGDGAREDAADGLDRQGLEDVDLGSREERGVHLERRILGRGADEHDVAGFDARQEGVLLGLVEAMNFVDEEDGAPAAPAAVVLGFGHHRANLLDAREHGAEGHEPRPGHAGDDARERRLAGSGRAPQDDRLQAIALDRAAQGPARAEQILLADELVERLRAHPLGERRRGQCLRSVGRVARFIEQGHVHLVASPPHTESARR